MNILYSWGHLVVPNTEELISRLFLDENSIRQLFWKRVNPWPATGGLALLQHQLCLQLQQNTMVHVDVDGSQVFVMFPQMAYLRGSIITKVAFVWLHDIVSLFLQDFPVLQTKVIIFKSLFHCQCVLCFAQMFAPNWVKSMIEFCFNFFMEYFHLLDKCKYKDTKKNVFMFNILG